MAPFFYDMGFFSFCLGAVMRMGSYSGFKRVAIYFLCFFVVYSAQVSASPALLLVPTVGRIVAAAVARRAALRVVAGVALRAAANDPIFVAKAANDAFFLARATIGSISRMSQSSSAFSRSSPFVWSAFLASDTVPGLSNFSSKNFKMSSSLNSSVGYGYSVPKNVMFYSELSDCNYFNSRNSYGSYVFGNDAFEIAKTLITGIIHRKYATEVSTVMTYSGPVECIDNFYIVDVKFSKVTPLGNARFEYDGEFNGEKKHFTQSVKDVPERYDFNFSSRVTRKRFSNYEKKNEYKNIDGVKHQVFRGVDFSMDYDTSIETPSFSVTVDSNYGYYTGLHIDNVKRDEFNLSNLPRYELGKIDFSYYYDGSKDRGFASVSSGYSASIDKSDISLASNDVSSLVNNLWLASSTRDDYKGIPFVSSDSFSQDEVAEVIAAVGASPTKRSLSDPVENLESEMLSELERIFPKFLEKQGIHVDAKNFSRESTQSTANPASNASQSNSAPANVSDAAIDPKDLEVDLEAPPTGREILAPIISLFSFLREFSLPEFSGQCPIPRFEVFDKEYVIDTHCTLIEQNRALIELFSSIVWAFISLRIILSA